MKSSKPYNSVVWMVVSYRGRRPILYPWTATFGRRLTISQYIATKLGAEVRILPMEVRKKHFAYEQEVLRKELRSGKLRVRKFVLNEVQKRGSRVR